MWVSVQLGLVHRQLKLHGMLCNTEVAQLWQQCFWKHKSTQGSAIAEI